MRHKKPNLKNRRIAMYKQKIAASTNGTLGKGFKLATAAAAVIIMTVFAAGTAVAGSSSNMTSQNVNVVNTPAVKATITAPGPLTSVGRLASQQVNLEFAFGGCPSDWFQLNADGTLSCFDLSSYPGQVLIVTDAEWLASGTAGNTCLTSLNAPGNGSAIFLRSGAVAAADSFATKSEHLTTGRKMTVIPVVSGGCTLLSYEMTGYLVPNQ
jgi:hypothetical protein